ncbi:hypothetical protein F183_A27540 [Bryobacterales bacterium F-183]|nr:hypothetical protein F183_A27540 [Bryobacterales bacterium F-183]
MYAIALLLTFQDQPSKQLQEQGFEIVEMPQGAKTQQKPQSRQVSHYDGKPRELKPAKMKRQGVPKFKKPKKFKK